MIITAIIDQNGNSLTVLLAGVLTALSIGTEVTPPPPPLRPPPLPRVHFPGSEWQSIDHAMEPNTIRSKF
jgi:hypothetical protein